MDIEALRPWNPHWVGGPITARFLKHPTPRAVVPAWTNELLDRTDTRWLIRPGPRQVGKTTSLGHVATRLLEAGIDPRSIVLAPLDDPTLQEAMGGRIEALIECARLQFPPTQATPLYLLLDEVQELPDWARQVKTSWDRHVQTIRVLATGSSALRILRPADADFHGRVRSVTVHPMKFREVIDAHPERSERVTPAQWDEVLGLIQAARQAMLDGQEALAIALDRLREQMLALDLDHWIQRIWLEYLNWGGYPAVRPGSPLTTAQRLEHFGSALDTVLARDVTAGGVRNPRDFTLLFRSLGRNPGGKFEPFRHGRHLNGIDGATIQRWMQVLEDTLLVQRLSPLKPNLDPDRGQDKVYPTDPGWVSFFRGTTERLPGPDQVGPLAETVVIDHLRRLQFNLAGTSYLPSGYVASPEVDAALQVGSRWLLVEVKYQRDPHARLDRIGDERAIRILATRQTYQLQDAPAALLVPAHLLALVC